MRRRGDRHLLDHVHKFLAITRKEKPRATEHDRVIGTSTVVTTAPGVGDVARQADEAGFPIRKEHTADCTLRIMAECLRREAEAGLHNGLVRVDQSPLRALAYLEAALDFTGRTIDRASSARLETIAALDAESYGPLGATVLDPGHGVAAACGLEPNRAVRHVIDGVLRFDGGSSRR